MKNKLQIADCADRIHKKYPKLAEPPIDVLAIAKELGILVEETSFGADISAVLVRKGEHYYIGLNSAEPDTRKRFSVAHEIGHFELHRPYLEVLKATILDEQVEPSLHRDSVSSLGVDQKEIEANEFAANLLMPKAVFEKIWNDWRSDIGKIANKFNVSSATVRIRAKKLGLSNT